MANNIATNTMANSMIDQNKSQKLLEQAQLMLNKFPPAELRIVRASLFKQVAIANSMGHT